MNAKTKESLGHSLFRMTLYQLRIVDLAKMNINIKKSNVVVFSQRRKTPEASIQTVEHLGITQASN